MKNKVSGERLSLAWTWEGSMWTRGRACHIVGMLLCAQLFCVLFFGDNMVEEKYHKDFKKFTKMAKNRIFNKGAYYG